MEDFDIFGDEIKFTKPLYMNILNKYVNDVPSTPNGLNYQSGKKLLAEESLASGDEAECAFHFSESVSASLRTMAVYRHEQLQAAANKIQKITSCIKPVKDLIDSNPITKEQEKLLDFLSYDADEVTEILKKFEIEEEVPFHKTYLRFTSENNVDNLQKILNELPKEWTVVQLTAPYNPNENLNPLTEYRTEINSIYLTVFTNDYLGESGPFTVNLPANVTKEGEKPLFTELYSLLDDNYKTIDNAQFLNNKRLVQNYWSRREDIDLRMKSVINVMDKEWLGGFGSLLTGKLVERGLRDKVIKFVDSTITDWGFIRLTAKQRTLLYNLIETCPALSSNQIKTCIRRILTEHINLTDIRPLVSDCQTCKDFKLPSEVCHKCLSKCFEALHHFTVLDGVKAFTQAAKIVREEDEWSGLKKAKRYPVILIVDEMLDTFPWETLPIVNQHPVTRIENIHFLYYLFKVHEKDIADGYFTARTDVGRYVINPENNLERMEKRMSSFVKYWCGDWTGHIREPPSPEDFLKHLTEADVFLYCGHGDGCRFANGGANGAGVEGSHTKAVVILSGCGSVRLAHPQGRGAPVASHHHLHIAACPMVVGMLWEVTDLEVDKVVSTLVALYVPSAAPVHWHSVGKQKWSQGVIAKSYLSSPMVVGMLWEVTDLEVDKVVSTLVALYVPSAAPVHWHSVGKQKWSQGVIDIDVESKTQMQPERDLLKAISRARGSTSFVMIASSIVARGLPVRARV